MTGKNLFGFAEYKPYLKHRLGEKGARSGLRAQMAEALGVQSSFISQVLHTPVHLSLEQACRANTFLEHDTSESHFFLLLIQRERAGSKELADYFDKQIQKILSERDKIKSRLATTQDISDEHQARYYSHWDYIAVHMALAVPGMRNARSLAQSLGLNVERVEAVLEFLVKSGLATYTGREFRIGDIHMHLSSDSPFIQQHHNNWRIEAMRRLSQPKPEHVHYSGVYSLSQKDYKRLRENLLQVIQDNLAVVKPSPEEIIVCQMIDLVPLSGESR